MAKARSCLRKETRQIRSFIFKKAGSRSLSYRSKARKPWSEFKTGQFFGEGCMNGHSLRIATTTAMEECLLTIITKTAMLAALHSEPKFSEMFMAYLLTRNSRIEEDLIDQLFNRAKSGWRACCSCWRISGRRASRNRSVQISARKHWPK